MSSNNDWKEVEHNLKRAQKKWVRLENILEREGLDRRTVGRFYVAVVQAMLLFGYETWVLNPPVGEIPRGFPPLGGVADGRHGPQNSMGWNMGIYTH